MVIGANLGDDQSGTDQPATPDQSTDIQSPATNETTKTDRKAGVVLLSAQGTANGSTKKFSSAGDWDLIWAVNCDGEGYVSINIEGDNFLIGPTTDKTAKGVEYYHDSGSYHIQVIGGPNCSWVIKAVTA